MLSLRGNVVTTNLVEQSAVTDAQQSRRLLPIPARPLQRSKYGGYLYLRSNTAQRWDGFFISLEW